MPGLFIVYTVAAPGVGRIENTATVIDDGAYAAQLTAEGKLFYYVPMDGHSGYFELDGSDNVVAMCSRDPWPGQFAESEVAVLEVATLPGVPPAAVRVIGPSTDKTVMHAGGDFQIRLGLPGTYRVSFEAFPYLRFETALTVTPTLKAPPPAPEETA